MKHTKKLFAIALTLIMALALTVPAFAAEGDAPVATKKTISIQNAVDGQEYTAYQVFGVTNSGTNYAYSISETSEFYETVDAYATAHPGTSFVLTEVGSSGVFTVVPDVDATTKQPTLDAAAFAAALRDDASKPEAAGTATASGTSASIEVNAAGYYFVDSSLGSLCALDTAVDSATIYEKNTVPSIQKFVDQADDPTVADVWDESTDAAFEQVVDFKLVVNTGTNNGYVSATDDDAVLGNGVDGVYTITDVLPVGMTVVANEGKYIAIEGWTKGTDYTETYTAGDNGDTLTIVLSAAKIATLGQAADIVITYQATVDDDFAINTANTNTATLDYKGEQCSDSAVVYTWDVPVFKYTPNGDAQTPLADATFTLSKNADGSEPLTFTLVEGTTYKYDTAAGAVAEITTDATGEFTVVGLDSGTYYLTETAAPEGYNMLTAPVTVVIDEEGLLNPTTGEDGAVVSEERIEVENLSGSLLPSTGGIGTTIFYVVGALLMAGAGVLLVTKKRMADEE